MTLHTPGLPSNDRHGFVFTLSAFALVLVVVSTCILLSEVSMGCNSVIVNEGMSDLGVLRSVLIGGGAAYSINGSEATSELYISEALQNASSINHMGLNFDQIVGNGTGKELHRASGSFNLLIKDSNTGTAGKLLIKDVPEGSRAVVADARLRLIATSCASSSTIWLDLNCSIDEGFVILYGADSLALGWCGELSPGDIFETDYCSRAMAPVGTSPIAGFAGIMIRGLLPLSFLQISDYFGCISERVAPYLTDVVVASLPDGVSEFNATILSLSAVAYYRGPLSGGDILYFS